MKMKINPKTQKEKWHLHSFPISNFRLLVRAVRVLLVEVDTLKTKSVRNSEREPRFDEVKYKIIGKCPIGRYVERGV